MATHQFETVDGQAPDILKRADGTIVRVVPMTEPPSKPGPDHLAVWDQLRARDALAATRYLEAHPSIYRSIEQRRRGAAAK